MESETKQATLPGILGDVTAPVTFSPSHFASLTQCPVKEIHGLPEEDMLSPSPFAILGDVVHEIMKEAQILQASCVDVTPRFVDDLFESKISYEEKRLSKNPYTRSLVPIRSSVGKTGYRNRRARLRTWATAMLQRSQGHPRIPFAKAASSHHEYEYEYADTARIPVGAERWLRVSSLRLSGRPDCIEVDTEGIFRITDFKTGNVLDRTGKPRQNYALQVRLYALMLQKIDERARVRLRLEGAESVEVPWGDAYEEETLEKLLSISEKLPAGDHLPTAELANEGPHCNGCRIRHRCPRYRHIAPTWWSQRSSNSAVAPFDIWGTAQKVVAKGEGLVEVTLLDDAGRLVRVSGIENESLQVGDRVWLFDLQPTQILPHQGVFVHPQNFHAKRPNRAWGDAVRFRGFVEDGTDARFG